MANRHWSALLVLDELAGLQLAHCLLQLRLRVHDDGPVPRHRFLERLTGNKQEADAFRAGLDHDLVAAVEEHQRMVFRIVGGWRVWVDGRLGQYGMRGRRIAEGSRAGKDIREGVASGFYLDAPALTRRNRNVDVARVCSHALDRPGFAPELAADHAGAGTVV